MPALFDTHCHLYADQFSDDLNDVIQRALECDIKHIMVPAENLSSSKIIIKLCANYKNMHLYAAAGIHPEYAEKERFQIGELSETINSTQVLAIGEIGLDYYWMDSEKHIQREVLIKCLELAKKTEKPVILHNRESTADMLSILHDWMVSVPDDNRIKKYPGVMHAFNGDHSILEFARSNNFYLGVGGPVTFKNATQLQKIIPEISLDKMLIETDAPYLSPHPYRGKRNEPANVHFVVKKIAEILGMPVEEVIEITTMNALKLFNINIGEVK